MSLSVKSQLNQNKLTSSELANELRTGYQLCQLFSDSIDTSLLNKNALSSRTLSVFNINLFLDGCKSNVKDLEAKYLFDAELLYDHVELRYEVLKLLSHLSKCKMFKAKASSFSLGNYNVAKESKKNEKSQVTADDYEKEEDDGDDNDQYYEKSLDIYDIYAPSSFFQASSASDSNEVLNAFKSNESKVNALFASNQIKIKTTDYVVRELLLTEQRYVDLLSFLQSNFLEPLNELLSHADSKKVQINVDTLLRFHQFLYAKLAKASEIGHGRSIRVCSLFSAYKSQLIDAYSNYFQGLNDSMELIDSLNKKSVELKQLLEKCETNLSLASNRSFKLNQLIVAPFQRVTKYHLLLKELFFNTEKHKPDAKEAIESAWKEMEAVCIHLNQVKRDAESLDKLY